MHETVDKMLARPIATIVIATCLCNGIAKIIGAIRGVNTSPIVNVSVPDNKLDTNT